MLKGVAYRGKEALTKGPLSASMGYLAGKTPVCTEKSMQRHGEWFTDLVLHYGIYVADCRAVRESLSAGLSFPPAFQF